MGCGKPNKLGILLGNQKLKHHTQGPPLRVCGTARKVDPRKRNDSYTTRKDVGVNEGGADVVEGAESSPGCFFKVKSVQKKTKGRY